MSDQTLMFLAKEVRSKTFKVLDGLTDQQSRFAAPGLCNSILWHAGHSLIVVEHLALCPMTGNQPSYPANWFEVFSWKSDPKTVTTWPPLDQVKSKLAEQIEKINAALEALTDPELTKIVDPARGRTLRWSIMHGFHDEANHQGEIWLLRKMMQTT